MTLSTKRKCKQVGHKRLHIYLYEALNKLALSCVLNVEGDETTRSAGGSLFHAVGPACEKPCSPNFVRTRGTFRVHVSAERSLTEHDVLRAEGEIMVLMYRGARLCNALNTDRKSTRLNSSHSQISY